jgi:hypothetical protein
MNSQPETPRVVIKQSYEFSRISTSELIHDPTKSKYPVRELLPLEQHYHYAQIADNDGHFSDDYYSGTITHVGFNTHNPRYALVKLTWEEFNHLGRPRRIWEKREYVPLAE